MEPQNGVFQKASLARSVFFILVLVYLAYWYLSGVSTWGCSYKDILQANVPGARCWFLSCFLMLNIRTCHVSPGGPGAEFKVLGSTGNVHRQANRKADRTKLLKTKWETCWEVTGCEHFCRLFSTIYFFTVLEFPVVYCKYEYLLNIFVRL